MKTKTSKLLGCLWGLASFACSGGDEPQGSGATTPITFQGDAGATCACQGSGHQSAQLTLACYRSLSESCSPTLEPLSVGDVISTLKPWAVTRHDGCGRTTFTVNWGLGGNSCTYATASQQLVGARTWSDTYVAPCESFGLVGGEADSCRDGTLCSMSGGDTSCVAACSLEAYDAWQGQAGVLADNTLGKAAVVRSCSEPRTRTLRSGCGASSVQFGDDLTLRFDSESQRLLSVSSASAKGLTCDGTWGALPEPCSDETTCSLCAEDADVCTPAQLPSG